MRPDLGTPRVRISETTRGSLLKLVEDEGRGSVDMGCAVDMGSAVDCTTSLEALSLSATPSFLISTAQFFCL